MSPARAHVVAAWMILFRVAQPRKQYFARTFLRPQHWEKQYAQKHQRAPHTPARIRVRSRRLVSLVGSMPLVSF